MVEIELFLSVTLSRSFFAEYQLCRRAAMGRGNGRGGEQTDLPSHLDDNPPAADLVESVATSKEAKKAEHDRQRFHAKKIGQFTS